MNIFSSLDSRHAELVVCCVNEKHCLRKLDGSGALQKNRPNGMDPNDYADTTTWDNNRWAWEFLSRDRAFYEIGKELRRYPGADEEAQIAAVYGLKKFKNALEEYDAPGQSRPKFVFSMVHAQARLIDGDRSAYGRELEVGEMVFKFSLLDALANPATLDAKVREVQRLARKKLLELEKQQQGNPTASSVGHAGDWLESLRLLDATRAKKTHLEIAKAVFARHCTGTGGLAKTDDELRRLVKVRKKQAEYLAKKGYLCIAACPAKPLPGQGA